MDKLTENGGVNATGNGVCIVPKSMIQYEKGVICMGQYDKNLLHKVYKDISEQLGIEAALTIHQMFKGTQVNFPIRFFDNDCVKEMILQEYDGTNIKMLATKYDYSETTVRRIIKKSVKKK